MPQDNRLISDQANQLMYTVYFIMRGVSILRKSKHTKMVHEMAGKGIDLYYLLARRYY